MVVDSMDNRLSRAYGVSTDLFVIENGVIQFRATGGIDELASWLATRLGERGASPVANVLDGTSSKGPAATLERTR